MAVRAERPERKYKWTKRDFAVTIRSPFDGNFTAEELQEAIKYAIHPLYTVNVQEVEPGVEAESEYQFTRTPIMEDRLHQHLVERWESSNMMRETCHTDSARDIATAELKFIENIFALCNLTQELKEREEKS